MKKIVQFLKSVMAGDDPILFVVFGLIIVIFVIAGIACDAWPLAIGALLLPVAYLVIAIVFRAFVVSPLNYSSRHLSPRSYAGTRTQVTFRSSKFPPYDGEQEQINPGMWGKRLAEYLVEKLKGTGIETEEIIPEDWGWYIPIKNEGFRLAICCGHQNGEDDEFLCFTDPGKPIARKLFTKIDATEQLSRLVAAMDKILRSDPEIKDMEWSDERE